MKFVQLPRVSVCPLGAKTAVHYSLLLLSVFRVHYINSHLIPGEIGSRTEVWGVAFFNIWGKDDHRTMTTRDGCKARFVIAVTLFHFQLQLMQIQEVTYPEGAFSKSHELCILAVCILIFPFKSFVYPFSLNLVHFLKIFLKKFLIVINWKISEEKWKTVPAFCYSKFCSFVHSSVGKKNCQNFFFFLKVLHNHLNSWKKTLKTESNF